MKPGGTPAFHAYIQWRLHHLPHIVQCNGDSEQGEDLFQVPHQGAWLYHAAFP